ncbi:MAG TPA: nucleoside-diphosphate kinase [Anaerolineae bacterium]|nr:nucleoside-diphosphate kinase [Anaerolineae bacterium]
MEERTERTLVILKPDAVQRGLIGPILTRLEQRGLRFAALKLMQVSRELAEEHYGEHRGKDFYPGLIEFITSGPVVVAVVEGNCAIQVVRDTMGKTHPKDSTPGSIRADFGLMKGRNLIHGSDGPESAKKEIARFFAETEVLSYRRAIDNWIEEPAGPG